MNKQPLRPAIAMIELIFAIVVIGITLLSAPLVLNQTIKSTTVAMQQESIAAAATQISLILTHPWDERASTDATGYGILDVNVGHARLDRNTRDLNTTYTTRRYNTNPANTAATLSVDLGAEGVNANFANDIDDFHNQAPKRLTIYAAENEALINNRGEYLDTSMIMTNTVSYARNRVTNYQGNSVVYNNPFTSENDSTNIKLIHVTLTTDSNATEHDKSIVLGAFSCNIGVPNRRNAINYRPLQP